MIMVPRNSTSGHVVMADLGTFTATNSFTEVQGVHVDNMLVCDTWRVTRVAPSCMKSPWPRTL